MNDLNRRLDCIQRGGEPDRHEVELALLLDADGAGNTLTPAQLALALVTSRALEQRVPDYRATVDEADEARVGPSAVDEAHERVLDEVDEALEALSVAVLDDRRRRAEAYRRAAFVAHTGSCGPEAA